MFDKHYTNTGLVTIDMALLQGLFDPLLCQSISLIATLRPESRIRNDMQLK